jgi:hypothetical protein
MQVADENRAAELMLQIGGSFAQHLARAFKVADSDNRARIIAAWPDLFERYHRMGAEREGAALHWDGSPLRYPVPGQTVPR